MISDKDIAFFEARARNGDGQYAMACGLFALAKVHLAHVEALEKINQTMRSVATAINDVAYSVNHNRER